MMERVALSAGRCGSECVEYSFNETFTSVARRYHVSPTSVSTIFDNHVDIARNKLPEIINFDEVYAFKSEKSKYVCVLLDFKKQIPVDVLPNRKKEYLLNYFQKIPLEERKKVKYACSDMYEVYRDVVHKVFPEAKHLLDYFHLSQDFHKKMNEVRIKVMKGYKDDKASDEYYLLKKFNWLLFKNPEDEDKYGRLFDVERERKYNSHFKTEKGWLMSDLLNYADGKWTNEKGNQIFFEGDYLLKTTRNRTVAFAQKAKKQELNSVWKSRLNKKYIVRDTTYYDIVTNQMLCSVEFNRTEDTLSLIVHGNKSEPVVSEFPIKVIDDTHAQSYLNTPCNGSRDRIEPYFEDGKLYCASYTYICEDDIEPYNYQLFEKENKVYKINNTLEVLPTICENHRILVLDSNGDLYYDSMDVEEYKPIESGFIILV